MMWTQRSISPLSQYVMRHLPTLTTALQEQLRSVELFRAASINFNTNLFVNFVPVIFNFILIKPDAGEKNEIRNKRWINDMKSNVALRTERNETDGWLYRIYDPLLRMIG